jgi:hypothetical protein
MDHKPEDRSGIDVRREGPFNSTFEALLNDVMYEPEAPDAALGITQGSLDKWLRKQPFDLTSGRAMY